MTRTATLNGQLWAARLEQSLDAPLLERVLSARGLDDEATRAALLAPEPGPLPDPYELLDMDRAVACLQPLIERRAAILVHGDYDADGLSATAILISFLRAFDVPAQAFIPNRLDEGYGLSERAIEAAHAHAAAAVITCDCGVRDLEIVRQLEAEGIAVVVTDHHLPGDELPLCHAVINPQRRDQDYAQPAIAGALVALKLTQALSAALGRESLWERGYALAALGTVADVMPLVGENRDVVRLGLEQMQRDPGPGLGALLRQTKLDDGPLSARKLAWTLAPRINAAGRLGRHDYALNLLLADRDEEAGRLALELEAINAERRRLEQEARAQVEAELGRDPSRLASSLLLVRGEDWHIGVLGLIASRLARDFDCAVLALAPDPEEPSVWRGSGRSGGQVADLHRLLLQGGDLLVDGGGHAGAVGFAVRDEQIEAFEAALQTALAEQPAAYAEIDGIAVDTTPRYDCELYLDELDLDTARSLERLEPYGHGHEAPRFLVRGLVIEELSSMGRDGEHLRLKLSGAGMDEAVEAVWFFAANEQARLGALHGPLALIAQLSVNRFRGISRVQLQLEAADAVEGSQRAIDSARARAQAAVLEELWQSFPTWGRSELAAASALDAEALIPTRDEMATLYRLLREQLPPTGACVDLPQLRASMPPRPEGLGLFLVARILDIYREAGLIVCRSIGSWRAIVALRPVTGRADLYATASWRRLAPAGEEERP